MEVPTKVPTPASTVRKESGISSCEGEVPRRWHQRSTSGMNIATTAVLLITAERGPTTRASKRICTAGPRSSKRANQRSIGSKAPLRTRAALITNIATTVITAGLPKPAKASAGLSHPTSTEATTRVRTISSMERRRPRVAIRTPGASSTAGPAVFNLLKQSSIEGGVLNFLIQGGLTQGRQNQGRFPFVNNLERGLAELVADRRLAVRGAAVCRLAVRGLAVRSN